MNYEQTFVYKVAKRYRDAGLSVIPIRPDGSKAPALASWQEFQERLATDPELIEWFSRTVGIGIVGGAISGGLEILDFDDGELYEPWYQKVAHIVDRLPVTSTPSWGYHIPYRCNEIGGNVKIAVDPSREKQTLIETRGQGGYIVAEYSPASCHPTGREYCHVSGPWLWNVPRITPDERRQLWAAARTFDKRGEAEAKKLRARVVRKATGVSAPVHPVVAAFNDRNSWDAILGRHGWTTRDNEHWTRPGKTFGVSARVVIADDGSELLTVFSGNAGPLSPDGSYRTWSKFNAWAALEHRGDNRAAFMEAKQEVSA